MNRSTGKICEKFLNLERVSRELFRIGRNDYDSKANNRINSKTNYCDLNFFNEEALDYDNKYFDLTKDRCDMDNEDDCFFFYPEDDICYCASCIMRNELLNMIENRKYGKNKIIDLKGNIIELVIVRQLPVVKRRGDHYFVVVKSQIKGFNLYYPMNEIFKRFYYLKY